MQYRTFGKLDWKGSALGFGYEWMPQVHAVPGEQQPYPAS